MTSTQRWTSADLNALPEDGSRYEIIDGELFVSTEPHFYHQHICGKIYMLLEIWSNQSQLGQSIIAPGLIFADDNDVVPDVAWLTNERLAEALGGDGKLHQAPTLAVEVLSPGTTNQRRDRQAKLKLYSRRGVLEYWIVDWIAQSIEIYRRDDSHLALFATLTKGDVIESPLLPGFRECIDDLFEKLPQQFGCRS
jgi:Uma2 family endonuclease